MKKNNIANIHESKFNKEKTPSAVEDAADVMSKYPRKIVKKKMLITNLKRSNMKNRPTFKVLKNECLD